MMWTVGMADRDSDSRPASQPNSSVQFDGTLGESNESGPTTEEAQSAVRNLGNGNDEAAQQNNDDDDDEESKLYCV